MRFGISATSWIFPKNLRTRLRPIKVCAVAMCFLLRRTVKRRGRLSGGPPSIATVWTGVRHPFRYEPDPCPDRSKPIPPLAFYVVKPGYKYPILPHNPRADAKRRALGLLII